MDNNIETEEIWRDIEGYEGLYQVSNLGRIRSCDRYVSNGRGSTKLMKSRVLRPGMDRCGYLNVKLYKDGKKKMFLVHRLVYEAFNCKRLEGMQINHIDENKLNNRLDNLNLMTPKQNINWGTANERRSKKLINHKSLSKPIIQYNINGKKLAEFGSLSDASRRLSISTASICLALKGRLKTAGGYIFKYKTA